MHFILLLVHTFSICVPSSLGDLLYITEHVNDLLAQISAQILLFCRLNYCNVEIRLYIYVCICMKFMVVKIRFITFQVSVLQVLKQAAQNDQLFRVFCTGFGSLAL